MYIMNVDWDWVKQRPHFLAQHLSKSHEMLVFYPYSWRRTHLVKNERECVSLYPFFRLPLGGRFAFIRSLNVLLLRLLASVFIKWHRPDIVWISSPELFEYLPKHFSVKLIYDCMDDVLAFPANEPRRDSLAASEMDLFKASSSVFCSSENLRDKLITRLGYPEKYSIVYNAFEPSAFSAVSVDVDPKKNGGRTVLGYVGTISSWIDFDALVKVVDAFSSVEIHLLGPIENLGMPFPQYERIIYMGSVRHSDIQSYIVNFDALIMPFQVTDLIQSVDPVKLYEYVFFNKPIVSVSYPEIERFSDFVDFYANHEELISIIDRYVNEGFKNKYSVQMRDEFVIKNTWAQRVVCIEEKLAECFENKKTRFKKMQGFLT